ncbi:response regulator transcription factor [Wenzhouxiangella sp. AB-CW3]|uniref:response regulator transcription factor n=1 Tax=Wenzhouxiangella sp. AB-CW3 TaxID=2771012 RepID=UPI00168B758A|nr:response regulator transcription factor [Wenzhouxiangella sp. AB-CW3]QOC23555.1 response regulator transcription factor [Wenzhouxiangella sp. AB-CW3]
MTTRVLIADDHPLFRAALTQALHSSLSDVDIIEAEDLPSTTELLETEPPVDLLLLDLHMPGNHGLAGLASIRCMFPSVAVVVVSANEEPRTIRHALDHGAAAYIPKSTPLPELTRALETVLDCREWVPAHLQHAVEGLDTDDEDLLLAERIASLTPQQFRVLALVADGQLNKQIAARLDIQERTVKAHMSEILQKLDVRNRTQAGIAFRRLELVDPASRMERSPG